ncbi:hypothetical protein MNAN1_000708 [Malassezia nana]|uniref:ATP-dependent DNA ligase family profile domain-containing protein n=1 Tax=Malassezia nana TaxID=180528 RepID=A0AAF0EPC0_9BASI|nr:hypothetical protein MNAN1_000708 [Malassezia nana]
MRRGLGAAVRVVRRWTAHSAIARPSAVVQELQRLRALLERVAATPRLREKEEVVRSYPDLGALLRAVYADGYRFHMTSQALVRFRETRKSTSPPPNTPLPSSVAELLQQLGTRTERGHAAKELVLAFLAHHGVDAQHAREKGESMSVLDVFYRCLDRHLGVGLSARSVQRALQAPTARTAKVPVDVNAWRQRLCTLGHVAPWPMPVALARTFAAPRLPPTPTPWYASRKLDGVRCLLVVDVDAYARPSHVCALSRHGRSFRALDPFTAQLRVELEACPHTPRTPWLLDGELCVWPTPERESFVQAASLVQSHTSRSDSPLVYHPFDMLTLDEFLLWRHMRTRLLSQRLEALHTLVSWLGTHCPQTRVRALAQTRLDAPAALESKWREAAAWEGLIVRQDRPYEGRRSRAMLKLLARHEAEFVVDDVEISTMRLPIDGVYAERRAVASLLVRYGDRHVSVGSGLRPSERVYWAQYPDDLRGRTVTISYAAEAANLEGHAPSLRFPVLKYVYEKEGRAF